MASDSFLLDRSLAVFFTSERSREIMSSFFRKAGRTHPKSAFQLSFVCFLDAEDYSPAVDPFFIRRKIKPLESAARC